MCIRSISLTWVQQQTVSLTGKLGGPTCTTKGKVKHMTFVNDIQKHEAGLVERITASFKAQRAQSAARAKQNRVYRETLHELQSLSNRDLADIGIHRSQIEGLAHDAAYGK